MGQFFSLSVEQGIGWLTFDCPGEKVNKLSSEALVELSDTLKAASTNSELRVLVFVSNKSDIFIAGADISEINTIATADDGYLKARSGQA
ncbi:fatty-acid oxidation protein subunit alpha, partial [bacterium]|nr:fatty-acid oxidation protein subunit alpha [bacterium]